MIHFSNPGEISIAAATIMGVNVKDSDDPIGQFGTGLKYTIAGVLRLGGTITIRSGSTLYEFSSVHEEIRDKTFSIVHMSTDGSDPIPLGFTLDLGRHWEPWMYIRELWSNCKDEGGTHGLGPGTGETVIEIDCYLLERAYNERDTFILNSESIFVSEGVEFHRHNGSGLFYRGILVSNLEEPARYTFNFKSDLGLTEDRTLRNPYTIYLPLGIAVMRSKNVDYIRHVLTCDEGIEKDFQYGVFHLDDTARDILQELYETSPEKLSGRALSVAEDIFGVKDPAFRSPTFVEEKKLQAAFQVLLDLGMSRPSTIRIPLDENSKALGFVLHDKIYITQRCLEEGVATVAATLIEEYIHLHDGVDDFSREMQDRLLRLIIRQYEEKTGEVL